MIGIYLIENKINGKKYVGQSIDIERRWKDHRTRKDDAPIHLAIQKYGVDNFSFSILQECKREELNKLEVFFIEKLGTFGKGGYNLNRGGNTCPEDFELSRREKISKACKGRVGSRTGCHLTDAEKENLRKASLGKKLSEETKMKISQKSKMFWESLTPEERKQLGEKIGKANIGKHLSSETKEKLRQANLGKKQSLETRMKRSESLKGKKREVSDEQRQKWSSIAKINIRKAQEAHKKKVLCETDNRVFDSMNECCDFYNVNRKSLRRHLRNGKPLKGRLYTWA